MHPQARLWTCGRGDSSTPSFGSHLNPIPTRWQIMLYILMSPTSFIATCAPAQYDEINLVKLKPRPKTTTA